MVKNRPKPAKVKRISTHYEITWIAEPVDRPEEIMRWRYGKRYGRDSSKPNLFVAELMRSIVPSITIKIFEGKAGDIRAIINGTLILATPPRPYEEWKYDFLKSDICVIGPIEKEREITNRFNDRKEISLRAKKKASFYIEPAKPYLDKLIKNGLVNGVLGRGSYFDKNGYPVEKDDVDFILLVNKPDKDNEERISKILREIPRFSVALVKHKDTTIKKGEMPEMSFIIVSKDMAIHAKGTKYERYVLAKGMGIGLRHLPSSKSEQLATQFMSLLPKHDNRSSIPRLPPSVRT